MECQRNKNHVLEIEHFLNVNKIDILLISESHATLQTILMPN
jgi:hypothetical protein